MDGTFGYGKKALGHIYLSAKHSLNGAQMRSSYVSFSATVSVKSLHATGDLLAGSHSSNGSEVSGNFDIRYKVSLAAGSHWKPWGRGYYSSSDKAHLNHANVIQISWSYGSYPGYWYAYQKSAIADDPNNNNIYGFNTASYRFRNSAVGGHRAQ